MSDKKHMTIVIEIPNDEFKDKVKLGGLFHFYGAEITAFSVGDEIEKNRILGAGLEVEAWCSCKECEDCIQGCDARTAIRNAEAVT